jgi:hypothetical protein
MGWQASMLAQRESDVIEYAQIGEQRAALKQHAHALAQLVQLAPPQFMDAGAVYFNPSGVGANLAADQPKQRGFAGAAGPHDRGEPGRVESPD